MSPYFVFALYRGTSVKDISRILLLSFCVVMAVCSPASAGKNTKVRQQDQPTLESIVEGAIGPFSSHSDGYGNPGASGRGYISVVTLHTGQAPKELGVRGQLDEGLDGLVAFDRAEASGAYIGQINLIVASSFSGVNGAIWGYDIAKSADLTGRKDAKLFDAMTTDARPVPVYSADPLLDAGVRLFGTRDNPKFPLLPGAQVIAAHKGVNAVGPTDIWCGVAIGVAEKRSVNASLIMELCGKFKPAPDGETDDRDFDRVRQNLAKSVLRVGESQSVGYKEIFVGIAHETIRKGYVGYAMVTVPFIVLAKNAIPGGQPRKLIKMNLTDWEKAVSGDRRP